MKTENRQVLKIIITISSISVIAILGSIFVNIGMDWFNNLSKPSQWIPNIIIPIVWTIIYLIWGIILSIWIKNSRIPSNIIILLITRNMRWIQLDFTKISF
jgi:tryptophan-rich sensory protein